MLVSPPAHDPIRHFEGAGVEPVYDLEIAAQLIPMSYRQIRQWLGDHKAEFPARYKVVVYVRAGKQRKTRIRLLLASEIRAIRERYLRGPGRTVHSHQGDRPSTVQPGDATV